MFKLLGHTLVLRFLALGILIVCLSLLSRNSGSLSFPRNESLSGLQTQSAAPTVIAKTQADAPLVISSPRVVSWDGQDLEVALDVVNVAKKAIRGYALGLSAQGEAALSGQIMFVNLDLSNKSPLTPNRIATIFDVHQISSGKEKQLAYFVDYVEFSDGSSWGADSGNNAQRSAGQRAAAHILSKRLLRILDSDGAIGVMAAIEKGAANIEPPSDRSEEWKEGFRLASTSISQRLKMAHNRKGLIDSELRQLAQRFRGEL